LLVSWGLGCRAFGAGGALEGDDLRALEFAPLAEGHRAEAQRADGDAPELFDGAAEALEDVGDLSVRALAEGDLDEGAVVVVLDEAELDGGWRLGSRGGGLQLALLEAREEGAFHLDKVALGEAAFDEGFVGAGDAEAGVGEAVGEVAVGGEEDEAGGVELEASDGEEARLGGMVNKVGEGGALDGEGGVVAGGSEGAGWLVEKDVHGALGAGEGAAVNADVVFFWVHEDRELGDAPGVDGDVALFDEAFAVAARGDAGIGHEALEAHAGGVGGGMRFGFGLLSAGHW
jgi:hypothetical protein